jgi:hypothetical protein
MEEETQGIG